VRQRAAWLRARPRSGPWSSADRQRLKDLYGTRRDVDLEVCLSRARADLAAMARQLCLAKDKRFAAKEATRRTEDAIDTIPAQPAPRRMPRWTAVEVEQLRRIYAGHDNLVVAKALGRTVTSVANKAFQLGLKKSPALLTDIGRTNVALRYSRDGDLLAGEA
jgi:hypothetical protein